MTATTSTTSTSINLGPGSFATPNSAGSPAFSMSSTDWLQLQTFFNNVKALPGTLPALSSQMGAGAPSDMSDFQKLVDLYSQMQAQGTNFTGTLYPTIVSLASDIYNYALSAPTYYNGLQILINQLNATPPPTPAEVTQIQTNMVAVVDQLVTDMAPYITRASAANTQLANFVSNLQTNVNTLGNSNPSPGTGYYQYYNNEYGTSSAEVASLNAQLQTDQNDLNYWQDKYNQDVIIAATTPTYGWIWPFGTIAAGVVAGVYGARATAALNKVHGYQASINALTQEKQADANLVADLLMVTNGITNISSSAAKALTIVQGIEGNWNAISSDLTTLSSNLNNDFTGTIAFLLQLNFNNIISEWNNLKTEADAYRNNAFITASN